MKYRLYNSKYKSDDVIEQVLYNRGIDDVKTYLTLDENVIESYEHLDNIHESVNLFDKHFQCRDKIGIVPDSDVDGQCSAAEAYLYIKRMDNEYPITILYHQNAKAHGLDDIVVPDDIKLLIVPDAGTNDYIQ